MYHYEILKNILKGLTLGTGMNFSVIRKMLESLSLGFVMALRIKSALLGGSCEMTLSSLWCHHIQAALILSTDTALTILQVLAYFLLPQDLFIFCSHPGPVLPFLFALSKRSIQFSCFLTQSSFLGTMLPLAAYSISLC